MSSRMDWIYFMFINGLSRCRESLLFYSDRLLMGLGLSAKYRVPNFFYMALMTQYQRNRTSPLYSWCVRLLEHSNILSVHIQAFIFTNRHSGFGARTQRTIKLFKERKNAKDDNVVNFFWFWSCSEGTTQPDKSIHELDLSSGHIQIADNFRFWSEGRLDHYEVLKINYKMWITNLSVRFLNGPLNRRRSK